MCTLLSWQILEVDYKDINLPNIYKGQEVVVSHPKGWHSIEEEAEENEEEVEVEERLTIVGLGHTYIICRKKMSGYIDNEKSRYFNLLHTPRIINFILHLHLTPALSISLWHSVLAFDLEFAKFNTFRCWALEEWEKTCIAFNGVLDNFITSI